MQEIVFRWLVAGASAPEAWRLRFSKASKPSLAVAQFTTHLCVSSAVARVSRGTFCLASRQVQFAKIPYKTSRLKTHIIHSAGYKLSCPNHHHPPPVDRGRTVTVGLRPRLHIWHPYRVLPSVHFINITSALLHIRIWDILIGSKIVDTDDRRECMYDRRETVWFGDRRC